MKKKTKMKFISKILFNPSIFLLFLVIIVLIIVTYFNNFENSPHRAYRNIDIDSNIKQQIKFNGEKLVHLDLKGAPPKVDYFRRIFPLISKMGATGLLIEYEDMFPYKGELKNIPALNAYSLKDIHEINILAENNNLFIIPLIQTFGHMEFVLKQSYYKEMREVQSYAQVICPSHNKTLHLLSEMVKQILAAHPKSKLIHVGCDEVYHLGVCNNCFNIMTKKHWSKFNLFFNHVKNIAAIVNKINSHIKVLIWDDILREMDEEELKISKIANFVTPVVWKYKTEVYEDLGSYIWEKYANIFPKLWIASAFKGATGSYNLVTNSNYHMENHRSWLRIISKYKDRINFEGIFITGWQRYDHFATLCELLPVAIPSLVLCLNIILGLDNSLISPPSNEAVLLECSNAFGLTSATFGNPKCQYPGGEILENVLNLKRLKEEFLEILEDSRVKGWMNDFNVKYSFSNPEHVETGTKQIDRMKMELTQIETSIIYNMQDIYDNYTIMEWIETYIHPFNQEIVTLWEKRESLLGRDVWPKRPINFNYNKELNNKTFLHKG